MSVASPFETAAPLWVGIDGGGTGTAVTLAQPTPQGPPRVLARGSAGAANLRLVPAAAAWAVCRQAIAQAFAAAGLPPQPIAAIALAMAGGGVQELREALAAEATQQSGAARVIVSHDARPLVAAGTPQDCGIALIAGTGSFAYCRTAQDIEDRCGGWGHLVGDEGSGYALVIAALRAALAAWDGRGGATELLPALSDWLGEPDRTLWPSQLTGWSRGQIAQGAPVVCQTAAAGDAVAQRLLDEAAEQLAQHLWTLWQRQFVALPVDLVFAGGLLLGCEPLRKRVLQRFASAGGQIGELQLITHPADAAVQWLARTLADSPT